MLLLGSILGMMFHENSSFLHIGIASCLLSAGTGCLNTPATTMALSGLEGKTRVDGSAIFNTFRQFSSSLASTLAILIYMLASSISDAYLGVRATYACYIGFSIIIFFIALNVLKRDTKVKE